MRKNADANLSPEQKAAADAGMKAMIPIGRPFLDHAMNALADAGVTDICLVIGPEHQSIRDYYDNLPTARISVSYAIQDEPLGTANAVLAAEKFVGNRRFIMVNGDNYYASDALARFNDVSGTALLGYDRTALVEMSNIPAERIASFALVEHNDNDLIRIYEKPPADVVEAAGPHAMVSMNCFAFMPSIFEACRNTPLSARGEYELTQAVSGVLESGEKITVVPVQSGVLDLSNQGDISSVEKVLRDRPVTL